MFSIRNGIAARRHWNAMLQQQREHGEAADTSALIAHIRRARPDMVSRLAELQRHGVTTIEGYWTAERCAAARAELDELMRSQPKCVRHFSNNSDKRVFGVEMAGPTLRLFHEDPFLKSVGEVAGGLKLYNLATLGARIDAVEANRGSGDGWHRDAFGFQFKAIIYLCDVSEENGPFEYVCGSQKAWRVGLDYALGRFPVPPDSRVDAEAMNRMIADGVLRPRRFTAKCGTLLLVNTAGIHGGTPLKSGHRYALTNYYYFPYQIGRSLVDKFEPLVPGTRERLAPFLDNERQAINAGTQTNHETNYA